MFCCFSFFLHDIWVSWACHMLKYIYIAHARAVSSCCVTHLKFMDFYLSQVGPITQIFIYDHFWSSPSGAHKEPWLVQPCTSVGDLLGNSHEPWARLSLLRPGGADKKKNKAPPPGWGHLSPSTMSRGDIRLVRVKSGHPHSSSALGRKYVWWAIKSLKCSWPDGVGVWGLCGDWGCCSTVVVAHAPTTYSRGKKREHFQAGPPSTTCPCQRDTWWGGRTCTSPASISDGCQARQLGWKHQGSPGILWAVQYSHRFIYQIFKVSVFPGNAPGASTPTAHLTARDCRETCLADC